MKNCTKKKDILGKLIAKIDKTSPCTNPELYSKCKEEILAGTEGGESGVWTPQKEALLDKKYKEKGGDYR